MPLRVGRRLDNGSREVVSTAIVRDRAQEVEEYLREDRHASSDATGCSLPRVLPGAVEHRVAEQGLAPRQALGLPPDVALPHPDRR